MAKEKQNASTVIPRAMVASYSIIGIANFAMLIAFCFYWVDPAGALASSTGYPFLEVFTTATS